MRLAEGETCCQPSHGGNSGSNPLRDANKIKDLMVNSSSRPLWLLQSCSINGVNMHPMYLGESGCTPRSVPASRGTPSVTAAGPMLRIAAQGGRRIYWWGMRVQIWGLGSHAPPFWAIAALQQRERRAGAGKILVERLARGLRSATTGRNRRLSEECRVNTAESPPSFRVDRSCRPKPPDIGRRRRHSPPPESWPIRPG